jgi:hypothetical protein
LPVLGRLHILRVVRPLILSAIGELGSIIVEDEGNGDEDESDGEEEEEEEEGRDKNVMMIIEIMFEIMMLTTAMMMS